MWAQSGDSVLAPAIPGMSITEIPPGPTNPRNSEGAFVELRGGRILFAYSRFTGGGQDGDAADIVARTSDDGGKTWSPDAPLVAREGADNVMSVSFLRLADHRIALFYIRKASPEDSRPYVRFSSDQAKTWTEARPCIGEPGYYVLNNDRVVALRSGRLVMPVALHTGAEGKFVARGRVTAYLSDDSGRTWRRSQTVLECPTNSIAGLQEPGVVELRDHRLLMFMRTMMGVQYVSDSADGGEHWTPARPSGIASPLSPASIKRIPRTGDLLMVWNDHSRVDPALKAHESGGHPSGGRRTPLTVAISRDEGKTWILRRNIEEAPDGWYCYTAILFSRGRVLLGFSGGGHGLPLLSKLDLVSFPVQELYSKTTVR
jgi:Neuraminidase (sialidase)